MDYKKSDIIKSLEELTLVYNNNIDCNKNPKLCSFSILLSETINKTILFLESQNNNIYKNNIKSSGSNIDMNTNINYEQLSKIK
jgi:hypothetical protein